VAIHIPTEDLQMTHRDYWLNIHIFLNRDMLWAPKGHEVAFEQFLLPGFLQQPEKQKGEPSVEDHLEVQEDSEQATVTNSTGFRFVLSKRTGDIFHLGFTQQQQQSVIASGPSLCTWRALTDNDGPATESKYSFPPFLR